MRRAGLVRWAGVSLPGSQHIRLGEQKSTWRLHGNRASPVSQDPGIVVPGCRLTKLRFFHVIAFADSAWLIKQARVEWIIQCSCAMLAPVSSWFIASAILPCVAPG